MRVYVSDIFLMTGNSLFTNWGDASIYILYVKKTEFTVWYLMAFMLC